MSERAGVTESGRILVIEAEGQAHAALTGRLRADGHVVATASGIAEALARIAAGAPDLVLVDQRLADGAGTDVIGRILAVDPDIAVVLLVAPGSEAQAVEAMTRGAADYLRRPLELDEVSLVLTRELERRRLRREARRLRQHLNERYRFPGVIGDAPAMQRLFKAMVHIAAAPGVVLITGEAGSGKTVVAGAIHGRIGRGPLVRLTAGDPVEARCQAARGGSLLVEEIADLSPASQLGLVQLLEQQEAAADADRPERADVRILAASGRDLKALADRGWFRRDLQDRVSGMHVHVPALRERLSDVPALAVNFLANHSAALGKPLVGFDREALAWLCAHSWPGNVGELESVVQQAVAVAAGPRVTVADLPPALRHAPGPGSGIQVPGWTMDQLERYAILETLRAEGGSTTRTAHVLGISVRNIQYKLRSYRDADQATDLQARPERALA